MKRNADPRVDAYIAKAAPFSRPILTGQRAAVHDACPDVEETLKWSMSSAEAGRFAPSRRKEYIEWITEARRDETRRKRLATTLEWLAQGKSRNWEYENC